MKVKTTKSDFFKYSRPKFQGVAESRYESRCRDAIYRVSTKVLRLRKIIFIHEISNAGTSKLMQEFYQEMLQQGKTPSEALRSAQRKLWSNPQWRSPYYWAGFTVQGEWR